MEARRTLNLRASIAALRAFRRDPIALLDGFRKAGLDIVEFALGSKKFVIALDPRSAEKVLRSSAASLRKSRLVFDKIVPITGRRGLVQLSDAEAKAHRRTTGVAFSYEALERVYPELLAETIRFADALAARKGRTVDLFAELTSLVIRNAMMMVFGSHGRGSDHGLLADTFLEANRLCGEGVRELSPIAALMPTRRNFRLRRARRALDRQIYAIVDQALADPAASATRSDLLSVLVRDGMERAQIRDHLATYLFAGHETTASSLAYTFFLLARNPEVSRAIRSEISEIGGDRPPEFGDLRRFSHVLNAYQESLRLFPPAWMLAREATAPVEIGGRSYPVGTQILLGVGQIHRHHDYWNDPEVFRPARFEGDLPHSHAFIPFGGGARTCIGMRTAFVEAAMILAVVLPRLRIEVDAGFVPEVQAMITAHPRGGLPVTIVGGGVA